jgi:branched-chain amino acid transport system permease protein
MISRLLSGERPGSRLMSAMLLAVLMALILAPVFFPGAKSLGVAAKILVFIVLAASYDLLLGYTGIVSFAHTMYFGIGAYSVAISLASWGTSWTALIAGVVAGFALSGALSALIGLFALRVKSIFYSMMTLAAASAFLTLASQFSDITGGEDGLTFKLPGVLDSGLHWAAGAVRIDIDGKILTYYLVFALSALCVLALLRIVGSPFGRVLQAIRENDFRAQAIGYQVIRFRVCANVLSAVFATIAGVMLALWLRYNGPDASLSMEIMVDITLITVIGGIGTIYGPIIGAALFILAQNYLQSLMASAAGMAAGVPLAAMLISPDRWLLWLGVLFIASVYYFPRGIAGRLRKG